jgi:hypothetical protein
MNPDQQKTFVRKLIRLCVGAFLALSITSCSVLSPAQLHGFRYEIFPDSGAELLDWRYGSGNTDYRRAYPPDVARGKLNPSGGAAGYMQVGDSLYAKWRILDTGKVFEETVDLRGKLPKDMTDHRIHFGIEQQKLAIYLVTPKFRQKGTPLIGPSLYLHYVTIRLHPAP